MKRLIAVGLLVGSLEGTTGAFAARPVTGGRDIQDFAGVSFSGLAFDGTYCEGGLGFTAGENLQGPIGSGKPGSWSDVVVGLQCEDGRAFTGIQTTVPPDITRLEHARLDGLEVELWEYDATAGTTVGPMVGEMVVNLEWFATGDRPTVRIGHDRDQGYFRQERFVAALVDGTLAIGSGDTFVGPYEGQIGHASEITLP